MGFTYKKLTENKGDVRMFGPVQHWIVGDDVAVDRHLAGLHHFFGQNAPQLYRWSIQKTMKELLLLGLAPHGLDDVLGGKRFNKNSFLLF